MLSSGDVRRRGARRGVKLQAAGVNKKLMEEIVPWVPRTFTNQTDIVGPDVVNYSYDEWGYIGALDHMAVPPA